MIEDQNTSKDNSNHQQVKALMALAFPERYKSIHLDHIGHVLYNLYREALERVEVERGYQHLLFDPEKEWQENVNALLTEMKNGKDPDRAALQTYTDRLLLAEAWDAYLDYLQQESDRQRRRATIALFNLSAYPFFWQRLKSYWLCLYPEERLEILGALTENKWQKDIPRKVTSVLEGAQALQKFDVAIGNGPISHGITREECDYIFDFSLSIDNLTETLVEMYRLDSN